MTRQLIALLVAASAWASPALAQARRPVPSPPAPQPAVTVAASVHAGLGLFAAADSFEAVFGSRSGPTFGAGGEARWRGGLFAGARVSRFQKSGTRVFVHEGEVFDLGIPSTVTITPIEIVAGYRFVPRRGQLVPYAGGGVGWHRYEERSDFAGSGEDVRDTFTGYHVLGGVEWRTSRLIGVAGEAQWTTVPDALGQHPNSVSAAFGETDLGGAGVRVRVIIGR